MKRITLTLLPILLLAILTSCASLMGSAEPTLVGGWKTEDEGYKMTRYFTEDGIYVFEEENGDYYYYDFGFYEADGESLYLDGYYENDYIFEGKTLVLGDETYRRTTRKATNNSDKLPGVWENDYYILGLATDGLVVSQGAYMNCKEYKAEENTITINGSETEYLVLNSNLYLRNFNFLKTRETIKLHRKSSGGVNKTGMNILCGNGPWFYQNSGSAGLTGTLYSFSFNGQFRGTEYHDGNPGKTTTGTFTLDGNTIHLSTGGVLIFAYIDETPFGYS